MVNMIRHKRFCLGIRNFQIVTGLILLWISSIVAADEVADFQAYKSRKLAILQQEYSLIAAKYENNPNFKQFEQRLIRIDEVAVTVIKQFDFLKKSSMQSLFKKAPGRSVSASSKSIMGSSLSISDLIMQYQSVFTQSLPLPEVTESERNTLREYYNRAMNAASHYIAPRGCAVAAVNTNDASSILGLCLVMPFLHIPDSEWSIEHVEMLPKLMRLPDNLRILEDLSFHLTRPYTAYHFYRYRTKTQDPNAICDYFLHAAETLFKASDYRAGMHCLKAGIQIAKGKVDENKILDLHLKLAETLRNMGHIQLAAQEVKQALELYPGSDQIGKLAILRLKYLYEANQFKEIIQKAPKFQADERCRPYLPQILYIAWVTHRRENLSEEAYRLQKIFLEKFPKHPLGADMRFASAMTALAHSDYDEALRLLEIIEYRYPDSRIMPKVKDIQQRLEKSKQQTK